MMVVIGGSLEVVVLLLSQVRRGIDSASFSSCLRLFCFLGGDFDIDTFGLSLALVVFNVAVVGFFTIDKPPLAVTSW